MSRLIGEDRDGRTSFVTESAQGTGYCVTVLMSSAENDWFSACGAMPLTAGNDGWSAALLPADQARGGDEVVGGQIIVTYDR